MMCIGNRVNLHLFLTLLTVFFEEIMIYQNEIIALSLSCHSPEHMYI